MQSSEFLKNDFSPVSKQTPISVGLDLMGQYTLNHIPVVEEGQFLGLISQESASFSGAETFAEIMYDIEFFFVRNSTHWQQVMELFGKYDSNIIPVLDDENHYVGYYVLADFIHLFTQTPFLMETGSFLVVEKNADSFSFSEISQIVESNQGKMLGAFISELEMNKVQITLKVNLSSLTNLLQTFRRYGYDILVEKEDDIYLKDLKEKSEYFSKYLTL